MRRVERWPWIWAAICSVLVTAVAALSVALYSASKAASTVDCVNNILGMRGPLTQADTNADLDFLHALYILSRDKPGTAAEKRHAAALIKQIATTYHVKSADQVARLKQPLGEC